MNSHFSCYVITITNIFFFSFTYIVVYVCRLDCQQHMNDVELYIND